MILAGDIGGTKTNLGLFEVQGEALQSRWQESFPSQGFGGLEAIVSTFLTRVEEGATSEKPVVRAACFGVAGPIVAGECVTPNLPWMVSAQNLAQAIKLSSVTLINDLEATAHGIGELKPEEMITLNEGQLAPGNAGLIAAGTGLGEASLFWDGQRLRPSASEGGHVDFAPRNQLEIELLEYLIARYGHVSVERVLSGPGLATIYDFLSQVKHYQPSPEVAARFERQDKSSVISSAALSGECKLSVRALDLFTAIYGATAGNLALMLKATGGMYLGGGIAPKILAKLKEGTFIKAFLSKGRLSSLLEAVPVRVIMNDKTALLGAARVAAEAVKKS
jgi:glucokinase